MAEKPSAGALGVDLASLEWRSAGADGPDQAPGALEVATVASPDSGWWVLLRVAGDPAGRVLVYDEHEWECFLDGVRKGEFDLPG
ncbi:MAG TPA: DUF397 domain-containing protein [Streptosporangiaceae bacterium]|nr:DUF397 domain-containing protein [Streptosporangiaceae bacterium]